MSVARFPGTGVNILHRAITSIDNAKMIASSAMTNLLRSFLNCGFLSLMVVRIMVNAACRYLTPSAPCSVEEALLQCSFCCSASLAK